MATALSEDQLKQVLQSTLSPDRATRNNGERTLESSKKDPSHCMTTLRVVASEGTDPSSMAIRQAAAVHFKNIVKKGWDTSREEGNEGIVIPDADRILIKSNLVDLMCKAPPRIEAQCCEAIALIADSDFPQQWDNLLTDIVQRFTTSNETKVVNGVLKTANAIFKRFRHVMRSDDLYRVISYCLERFQKPLTEYFVSITQHVLKHFQQAAQSPNQNAVAVVAPQLETLRLICRIFYSLNYQDLPEYFEDNVNQWMEGFLAFLDHQKYAAVWATNNDDESDPIDKLQIAVIQNFSLYSSKDEECFLPFLPQCSQFIWGLLLSPRNLSVKHDALVLTCIQFLSGLVVKSIHNHLFKDDATLQQIVGNIVIPNLTIREEDEERFEDDPAEHIRVDLEGNDADSRRNCSLQLLRDMCRHFSPQVTAIVKNHVKNMLEEYNQNQLANWKSKDVATQLIVGVAIVSESSVGVSRTNPEVNLLDYFSNHVFPELEEKANKPAILRAAALKFTSTFRNQFQQAHMVALMPHVISNVKSKSVVVSTYAAHTIERFLVTKETDNQAVNKFGLAQLQPLLEPLFSSLFEVLEKGDENEYVMRCIMRSLNVARDEIVPVTETVLTKLTHKLSQVSKSPQNPQFNHYLFESIAVLIKAVCSKNPEATSAFENMLFPPLQTVLQLDVSEFTPYVFQILAQLLEFRPRGSGLGDAYTSLLPPILSPLVWERQGNIPALARLVRAYLDKAGNEISSNGTHLQGILGVFQKLTSSGNSRSEENGFGLISSILFSVPDERMTTLWRTVFQILLAHLNRRNRKRFKKFSTDFFALFAGKHGGQRFLDELNRIQAGLGLIVITKVWIPRLDEEKPTRLEAKSQVIGLTKVLTETPALLADSNGRQIWAEIMKSIGKIMLSSDLKSVRERGNNEDNEVMEIVYDGSFSMLSFARRAVVDPFASIDPVVEFCRAIGTVNASHPGIVRQTMETGFQSDEDRKLAIGMKSILQAQGVAI